MWRPACIALGALFLLAAPGQLSAAEPRAMPGVTGEAERLAMQARRYLVRVIRAAAHSASPEGPGRIIGTGVSLGGGYILTCAGIVGSATEVLVSPSPGDTAWAGLAWTQAADPDSGDRVTYRVRVGSDSTLADAGMVCTTATSLAGLPLLACRWYWWSVEAVDRAGDATASTPEVACFYQPGVLDAGGTAGPGPPRARPNPSRGPVALEGMGADVAVYDLAGRCVAGPGHGVRRGAGTMVWDGLDGGRPAAPGLYLAHGGGAGRTLRIVRLR